MAITNEQLAELLIGVATSEQAIIDAVVLHLGGVEGQRFRDNAVIPTLQGYVRSAGGNVPPTLQGLSCRLLLLLQATPVLDAPTIQEEIGQELERMFA